MSDTLRPVLEALAAGALSVDDAAAELAGASVDGYARIDVARARRQGMPEAVFGQGKTPDQVVRIVETLRGAGQGALVTRCSPEMRESLCQAFPDGIAHQAARTFRLGQAGPFAGKVAVLAAGTSDIPVAEEAIETLVFAQVELVRYYDVGVAGLHRILAVHDEVATADAILVVAGMDGALFSVAGGLFAQPVIAVPTSVGYGAALSGFGPLLSALNACAAGVAVVNIDNGFGGARAVLRTLLALTQKR